MLCGIQHWVCMMVPAPLPGQETHLLYIYVPCVTVWRLINILLNDGPIQKNISKISHRFQISHTAVSRCLKLNKAY